MAKEQFFKILNAQINLDPKKLNILEKIYQFLSLKSIDLQDFQKNLLKYGFSKELVGPIVEAFNKEFPHKIIPSKQGDNKEIINSFYKKIVHLFLNDLLFLIV